MTTLVKVASTKQRNHEGMLTLPTKTKSYLTTRPLSILLYYMFFFLYRSMEPPLAKIFDINHCIILLYLLGLYLTCLKIALTGETISYTSQSIPPPVCARVRCGVWLCV